MKADMGGEEKGKNCINYYISLFQALGLWGKSEKAGERGKDERGRRRAKEREPVRISLTALCRYSRSCYTL